MKAVAALIMVGLSCTVKSTLAFQSKARSAFVGRNAIRIPGGFSSPPMSSINQGLQTRMEMPPFLKKLGLGSRTQLEDEDTDVVILDPSSEKAETVDTEQPLVTSGDKVEDEEEQSETQKLLQKVKDAGTAGFISYAGWELAFWLVSIPVCIFGYREVTGHWPDLTDSADQQKLFAEGFAFINFARFAVPLRIGLALSTTPWVEENIVQRFLKNNGDETMNSESEE